MSSTNLRLVHADQCTGVAAVIPDTDGKGGGGSGGGGKPHGGGGSGGGGHSGIKTFFLVVLVTGGRGQGGGIPGAAIWQAHRALSAQPHA